MNPHKYALMGMVFEQEILKNFVEHLEEYVEFFIPEKEKDGLAPQHVSIVYFSYPDKYPRDYVKKFEPKIIEKLKTYMPIKLTVNGIEVAKINGPEGEKNVLLWRIKDWSLIEKLHRLIRMELSNEIEHFKDVLDDYSPYIGIAVLKDSNLDRFGKVIDKINENFSEFDIHIRELDIFYESGIEKVYSV